MYRIREAAARTGVSVPTIRVWERRYGVVQPERTPAGYRLYDDEAIARLTLMRRLIADEGWQPRQAAQRVLEPGATTAATRGTDRSAASSQIVDGVTPGERERQLVTAFVAATRDLDVPAMERILDEGFASNRFELAIERVVSPALREIGSAWAVNEIDVGAEHAASETVRRRLARFYEAAGLGDRSPQVIVGLPPDGQHDIGAFAFAVAARRAGLGILYIGANVPLESWIRTVRDTAAPITVLGVVTPADVGSARAVIDALSHSTPPPICLVGGPLSATSFDGLPARRLPEALDDAVAMVAALLQPGSSGRD